MRVERQGFNTIASGDLYYRSNLIIFPRPSICPPADPFPDPGKGIPIFSRGNYRYYLRVTQILEWITLSNSFTLGFEMYRFDTSTPALLRNRLPSVNVSDNYIGK